MMHDRIEGIDYLRAMMSVFVVVWHMGGGGKSLIFSRANYVEHVFTLSDLVNFHLLLLAVPVFIFVSNFLYASQTVDNLSLRKRLKRIVILLTFWPIVYIACTQGIEGLIRLPPNDLGALVVVILGAGNTIYYFFVCLLVSTFITHLVARLKPGSQFVGCFVSVVLLTCLPWLTISCGFYPLSAYWSPLNVIPFSFAAVLVAQNLSFVQSKKVILVCIFVVLGAVFSVFEWHYAVGEVFFDGQGYAIPAYTRTSLLFSTLAITIVSVDGAIRSNAIVAFMARYSLALYCIHPFLMDPVRDFVSSFTQSSLLSNHGAIILVILSSYCLAIMLLPYLNKRVLM